jgi:hypothetical protein
MKSQIRLLLLSLKLNVFILFFSTTTSIMHSQCLEGDCINGIGKFQLNDQSIFEGEFKNGEFLSGKITYNSGSIYEGEFSKNIYHGKGKFHYFNGDEFDGYYLNGEKTYGKYHYKNGNEYWGEYAQNKPNGFGTFTLSNGKKTEGFWKDGKKDYAIETASIPLNPDTISKNNYVSSISSNSKFSNPRMFAVIVGIADYYSNDMDLNYSDDDAMIFYKHLKSAFENETRNGEISLLLDHDATHENILKELNRVFSKSTENDYIIFFFSGHGGNGVFCPADAYNNLYHSEVKEAFRSSNAKYRLCIADACHSGSMVGTSTISNYEEIENLRDSRIAVILSSSKNQVSRENSTFQQGVFSYYLMQGLNGKGDINNDQYVTAGELFLYTREAVNRYSRGSQIPVIAGQSLDKIPLCKLRR